MDENKPTNYFIVYDWMVNDLKLKGSDLMVYALIFGFTIGKRGKFYGTLRYLANRVGVDKDTAFNAINRLLIKSYNGGGIIRKETEILNGTKYCYYRACINRLPIKYIEEAIAIDS